MNLKFSLIIPVYNRPQEIEELLYSLTKQDYKDDFEVLIIEDGSEKTCVEVLKRYEGALIIRYFYKDNSGAGLSRNVGMEKALGNYFIILDSDVLLPNHYLSDVAKALNSNFTNAFGGADKAHVSFTTWQKAINFSMTSLFTTGGIRGKKKGVGKFQPRSFNMGISKKAFEATKGFSELKYGEDIDLTFRLWEAGFETQFIEDAYVYHKRRTNIKAFYKQTFNFGTARPYLNRKYPDSAKLTYWFPSLFIIGFDIAILLALFLHWIFILPFVFYFLVVFVDSFFKSESLRVAFCSIVTTYTQFLGYGLGFLKSTFFVKKID
ncbi:MAG: glycosyl transferase family 2 [Flavobacteriaceae bacterium]|nr:MAG: glycosyl transferase family 2 [Flavobacteriaceae bacterium]